jgi:hypothetical protein
MDRILLKYTGALIHNESVLHVYCRLKDAGASHPSRTCTAARGVGRSQEGGGDHIGPSSFLVKIGARACKNLPGVAGKTVPGPSSSFAGVGAGGSCSQRSH